MELAGNSGPVQGCSASHTSCMNVGACVQQDFDGVDLVATGGIVQGRPPALVSPVNVGPTFEEKPDDVEMATGGCKLQGGRFTKRPVGIDIRAFVQLDPDGVDVALIRALVFNLVRKDDSFSCVYCRALSCFSDFLGTVMRAPHCLHLARVPANSSFTLYFLPQLQVNSIMFPLYRNRQKKM